MTWSMQFGRKGFVRAWFAIIACFFGTLSHASAQVLTFDQAKQRADQGDAFAQAVVALHYQLGWNTEKSPELAAKYAIASANARHPYGLFRLGSLMIAGEGVPKDEERGRALQAASFNGLDQMTGDPYALTSLGVMIFQGKAAWQNVPQEQRRQQAAQLYKRAADLGFAPALFNYAMALNDGHGVPKNDALFEQYLSSARNAGYPFATAFVASQSSSSSADEMERVSSVDGIDAGGARWVYRFLDTSSGDGDVQKLGALGAAVLLFSDDEWIVTAASDLVGYSKTRTTLRFYDARNLKEVRAVSVPNEVNHIDWSAERRQFLLVTFPPGRSPSDENAAQALVLIDPDKNVIERIPIWRGTLNFIRHNFCAPLWRGDEVHVFYKPDRYDRMIPAPEAMPHEEVFRDVKIVFQKLSPSEQDPKLSSTTADTTATNLAGITNHPNDQPELDQTIQAPRGAVRAVETSSGKDLRLVRHSVPGVLQQINLSDLTGNFISSRPAVFGEVGVFANGVVHAVSGNNVHLFGPTGEKIVAIPTPQITRTWPLPEGGEGRTNLTRADSIRENGVVEEAGSNMQVFFGEDAGYCFSENGAENSGKISVIKIDPRGELVFDSISIPSLGPESTITRIAIEPERKSIRLAIGKNNEPLITSGEFKEFSFVDGELLLGPEPIGSMLGPVDRKAGHAPKNWMVEALLLDAISGDTIYGVRATNLLDGKVYSVAEVSGASLCNREPALWFLSHSVASVLSRGDARADLYSLNTNSGKSKRLKTWEWSASWGDSVFEPSRRLLFIPQQDGYTIYDLSREDFGKSVANMLFSTPYQYAIILPSGSYAGSPGCESLLRLKAGDGSVDGSSIAQWRNRPAEVLKALGGDPEQMEVLAKVTERWQKRIGFDPAKPEPKASDLPKVSVPERPPLWANGEEAAFTIQWEKGASPLNDVIVRVNGVESARFEGDTLPIATEDKGTLEATVKLAEGQNWIEVTAEDVEGRRSDLQRFRTILKDSPTETKRYIVALGVSEYAKPELNLQFAAKDAKDLLEALAGNGAADTGMFAKMFGQSGDAQGSDHVLLLTNDQVDRSAVEKIREFVGKSSESDEVILFCAGHGVLDDKLDYYYAGHDFDPDRPSETGIKLDDLVGAVSSAKALKRLVLLDTCHAGVVGEKDEMLLSQMDTKLPSGVRAVAQRGMKVQQAADFSSSDKQRFIEEMFSLPGTIRGVNIIGASAGAQFALESDKWNNGVFTASVIEGLRDKKADWNEDGRITVSELKNYLGQRVSELTAGAQKPSVVAFEQDQDFNLLN